MSAAPPRRPRIRTIVVTILATVILVALLAVPIAAMHRTDLPLERAYGNTMVSLVSRIGAGNATNPLANNARATESGRIAYVGSCGSCHGALGDGKGVFGPISYPPASDLTSEDATEKSDGQLFWITKNGISFTGMPGFGGQYTEQDLWAIVAYIRALQQKKAGAISVPVPTSAQLAMADPHGTPAQRGAAIYFAEGCAFCHGAVGNAPGELGLGSRVETQAIRFGRRGMPAYGREQLSEADLQSLVAYMQTFNGRRGERD